MTVRPPFLPDTYRPCTDPGCEYARMPAYDTPHWHHVPAAEKSSTCARCDRPARGYAFIGEARYCHSDDERPSCYEQASFEQAFPAEPPDSAT